MGMSPPSSFTFIGQIKEARPQFAPSPRSVGGAGLYALFSVRKQAQSPEVGTEEKKIIEKTSQEAARSYARSFEVTAACHISPSAIPNQSLLLWKQSSRPPQRLRLFNAPWKLQFISDYLTAV